MSKASIRFEDGAGYERAMGIWSQLAGAHARCSARSDGALPYSLSQCAAGRFLAGRSLNPMSILTTLEPGKSSCK